MKPSLARASPSRADTATMPMPHGGVAAVSIGARVFGVGVMALPSALTAGPPSSSRASDSRPAQAATAGIHMTQSPSWLPGLAVRSTVSQSRSSARVDPMRVFTGMKSPAAVEQSRRRAQRRRVGPASARQGAIRSPARPRFQAAAANFMLHAQTKVNTDRC